MDELHKSFIENSPSFLMHYNHNHDKLGRFAKSNGSGSSGMRELDPNSREGKAFIKEGNRAIRKEKIKKALRTSPSDVLYGTVNKIDAYRKSNLKQFRSETINDETIARYKTQAKQLSHVRTGGNTKGEIFTDKNGKLVGMINTEKKDDGNVWIQGVEVFGENKAKGIGYRLIDHAVKDMGATHLSVNKSNTAAKNLYDKYGFETYKSDDTMNYMRIRKKK